MRAVVLLSLLCMAVPLHAQGFVAGYVVDSATRAPLQCIDVALQDTAGPTVARQPTQRDGSFLLNAPPRGEQRPRLSPRGQHPRHGPLDTLEPTTETDSTIAV